MNTNCRILSSFVTILAFNFASGIAWANQGDDACLKPPTVVESVRVFDGEKIIPHAHVVIRCERISEVIVAGDVPVFPEGSTTINGNGKTLLPGLFESHAHTFRRAMLERSLDFGVTTVLDMGSVNADFVGNIKAEDKEGQATDRADLFSAILWVTAPGSHGTQFGEIPTLTEPADAAAFVAHRVEDGADFVKIIYDNFKMVDRAVPTLSKATLIAVVGAAHEHGKLAVVHSRDVDAYADVIEAGADGFVHVPVDQVPDAEMVSMLKKKNMYVGPNLSGMKAVGDRLTEDPFIGPLLTDTEREGLLNFFPKHREGGEKIADDSVAAMHKAGITLLAGSDSPNAGTTVGASMHLELEMMVDLGLSPIEALRSATSSPARVFRIQDRGRIAEGLLADLLLVEGRPDENIKDTRRFHAIWKAGVRR